MTSNLEEATLKEENHSDTDLNDMTEQEEKIQRLEKEFGRMADVMREMVKRQDFRRLDLLANEADVLAGRVGATPSEQSELTTAEIKNEEPENETEVPLSEFMKPTGSESPVEFDEEMDSEAIRNFIIGQNLSVSTITDATGISRSTLSRWIRSNDTSMSSGSRQKLKNWYHDYRLGDGRTYTNRRFPEEINMLIREEVDKHPALNYDLLTALWQKCNSFSDVSVTRKQVRDKFNKMKKKVM